MEPELQRVVFNVTLDMEVSEPMSETELLTKGIEEGTPIINRIDKYAGGEWYSSAEFDGDEVVIREKITSGDDDFIMERRFPVAMVEKGPGMAEWAEDVFSRC